MIKPKKVRNLVFDLGKEIVRLKEGDMIDAEWSFQPVDITFPPWESKETYFSVTMRFRCKSQKISIETPRGKL